MMSSELFSYDELEIGQFFLIVVNGNPSHYGLKISHQRYFDLDQNVMCWLYQVPDCNEKVFLKCDYEVW